MSGGVETARAPYRVRLLESIRSLTIASVSMWLFTGVVMMIIAGGESAAVVRIDEGEKYSALTNWQALCYNIGDPTRQTMDAMALTALFGLAVMAIQMLVSRKRSN